MDVEFDCGLRFAHTDKAVGTRWVKHTWDQQLLPEVGTLVQEDLERRQPTLTLIENKPLQLTQFLRSGQFKYQSDSFNKTHLVAVFMPVLPFSAQTVNLSVLLQTEECVKGLYKK